MSARQQFHRLRFFVVDAWDEWRHSPGINLLAVATLASTLFLAGILVLFLSNVENRLEQIQQEIRVEVYLKDDAPDEGRQRLQRELESTRGVARVDYVDKASALARYRTWAGESAGLIDELQLNPLPASLEVFLVPGPDSERNGGELVQSLAGRAGIEEVRFNRDWVRRLESLLNLARFGGTVLALVVLGAVVFVMASVLRLAVYARREEIEIMLLVGATPAFVRGPFLVAGLGQGLVSSALALVLVEGIRRLAWAYGGAGSPVLLDLVAGHALPFDLSALLVLVGLLVSLISSYFAVRRSFSLSS